MHIGRLRLQDLLAANAVVLVAGGLFVAFVATPDSYPFDLGAVEDVSGTGAARQMIGITLVGLGLMAWLLREVPSGKQRQMSGVLFAFFSLWAVVMLGHQQSTWWDISTEGSAFAVSYALLFWPIINAAGFGAFFFFGPRTAQTSHKTAALTSDGVQESDA